MQIKYHSELGPFFDTPEAALTYDEVNLPKFIQRVRNNLKQIERVIKTVGATPAQVDLTRYHAEELKDYEEKLKRARASRKAYKKEKLERVLRDEG